MVKLERKFKYAGLRASFGLPQDEQDMMQRELGIWKRQAGEAQKKVTQLERTARAKDAHHLEEIERLKAVIRNDRGKHQEVEEKNESLEGMVQTLEHKLQ